MMCELPADTYRVILGSIQNYQTLAQHEFLHASIKTMNNIAIDPSLSQSKSSAVSYEQPWSLLDSSFYGLKTLDHGRVGYCGKLVKYHFDHEERDNTIRFIL